MCKHAFPKNEIRRIVNVALAEKLERYDPETKSMPFLEAVLSKERVKSYSFVQSLLTTFGMSFYEQMAVAIARPLWSSVHTQYELKGSIPDEVSTLIRKVMGDLRGKPAKRMPNKEKETQQIRALYTSALPALRDPDGVVDLRLVSANGAEYLFDITTAKPNMKEFAALKEKTLKWTALALSQNPKAEVTSGIAIPYNPYEPEPYSRFTLRGIFDIGKDLLVGEDFWNLVGRSPKTYPELLAVLQDVGEEWKPKIDKFISELAKSDGRKPPLLV